MALGIFLAAMDGTVIVSLYATIGSELKQLQNTSWIALGHMHLDELSVSLPHWREKW
jgi:replication initiation and membrane attachment protein DnaB